MRRALIGLILAATAMSSVAAEAQNWRGRDGGREHNQNARGEARAERFEQRQSNQPQSQPVQAAPQAQEQTQAQFAQRDRGNRGGRGGNNGGYRGNWQGNRDGNRDANRGNQGSIYPQAWQGNPNDPQLRHYQELERRNQQRYGNDGRNGRNDRDGRRDWNNDRNDRRDWNNGRNDWRGDRTSRRDWRNDWNRGWRDDRRYDWQRWRYSNRSLFHLNPYYAPYRGWGYNRFSIGVFLDELFYDQRYWIGDPWQYRLPPAYPGTQWVRYYNDVLLVDVYTGEVVDVIYDFFW